MTELITLLSTGKGTWSEVAQLIKSQPWEKVFIITNDFGKDKFNVPENGAMILINPEKDVIELKKQILSQLKGKITGLEVALHITSGSGKEHMALLSALMSLGVGFRFVTVADQRFMELQ